MTSANPTPNNGDEQNSESTADIESGVTNDVDRRDVLAGAVAVGSTLMAGCSGNGNGNGSDQGGGDGDGTTDQGNDGGASGKSNTVHFISAAQAPKFKQFWEKTGKQFEEETGNKLKVSYAFDTSYQKKVSRLLQAGNAPEIINVEGFNIGQFISENLMSSHTNVVNQFNEKFNLPENFRLRRGGEDRWYPSFTAPAVHWYRGDQMEEVGWSGSGPLGTPATFAEYKNFYETMDGHNNMRAGLIATGATDWGTSWNWSHLWQNGITISDFEDGETTIELENKRPQIKDYLKRYNNLYDTGSPDTANYSWGEAITSFTSSDVHEAMYLGARHKVQSIRKGRDWAPQVKPGPVPGLQDAGDTPYFGSVSGWGVMEPSNAKESAKEYIQSIMMDKQTLIDFYQKSPVHNSPVMKSWWDPDHVVWDTEEINEGFNDEQLNAWFSLLEKQTTATQRPDKLNLNASKLYFSYGLGRMMYEYCNNDVSAENAINTGINVMEDSL